MAIDKMKKWRLQFAKERDPFGSNPGQSCQSLSYDVGVLLPTLYFLALFARVMLRLWSVAVLLVTAFALVIFLSVAVFVSSFWGH